MIEKVSYLNVGNSFKSKNEKRNNNNLNTNPVMSNLPTSKYSMDNLKANYLPLSKDISFGSTANKKAALFTPTSDFGFDDALYEAAGITKINKNIEVKLTKGDFYNETANDLAILLGPDKNALLTKDKGVNPEILIHMFAKNVENGKYEAQGLSKNLTDIYFAEDVSSIEEKVDAPFFHFLSALPTTQSDRKKVIFVNNFELIAQIVAKSGCYDVNKYVKGMIPDISIIGIVPKEELAPPLPNDNALVLAKKALMSKELENIEKIDVKGLNVTETKNYVRKNPEIINKVLDRYSRVQIEFPFETLDKLIERSSTAIDGAFPDKLTKVLDMVATAKIDEAHAVAGSKVVIEPEFVESFFENHTAIIDKLRPEQGQFKIAENVKERFSDIGGIGDLKEDLQDELIAFAKDPKGYIAKGGIVPSGKIFSGPPGTGKTLLARIIAGESGAPFYAASGSEMIEKYVGVGPQRIRDLRDAAVKGAIDSGKNLAYIFIDEIDAIGGRRTGEAGGNDEREATLNQLLTEMDGFNSKSSKVKLIWMAATNRTDILDEALMSRFEEVPMPNPRTKADRLEILNIHTKKLPFSNESEKTKIMEETSKLTEGMSGRDIKNMMTNVAKVTAKKPTDNVVRSDDMLEGFLRTIIGKRSKTDLSPEDVKVTAIHEGVGHAYYNTIFGDKKVIYVSNEPRGEGNLGFTYSIPAKKIAGHTFESVIKDVVGLSAGGYAESLYKKAHDSGVGSDYQKITSYIETAIKSWGLGINTPQMSFLDKNGKENVSLVKLYEREIKADVKIYIETAGRILNHGSQLQKDFMFNAYLKKYDEAVKNGTSPNFDGDEYRELFNNWLEKSNKLKEKESFLKHVDRILESARTGNKNIIEKIATRVIKK